MASSEFERRWKVADVVGGGHEQPGHLVVVSGAAQRPTVTCQSVCDVRYTEMRLDGEVLRGRIASGRLEPTDCTLTVEPGDPPRLRCEIAANDPTNTGSWTADDDGGWGGGGD